jgi:hypothetical protein
MTLATALLSPRWDEGIQNLIKAMMVIIRHVSGTALGLGRMQVRLSIKISKSTAVRSSGNGTILNTGIITPIDVPFPGTRGGACARGTLALGLHPTIVLLAAGIEGGKEPGGRILHVIGSAMGCNIGNATFVISRPIGEVLASSCRCGGRSKTVAELVVEKTLAAIILVGVQPERIIVYHVIGGFPVVLASLISRRPIGVPFLATALGICSSHARAEGPTIVLLAAVLLGREDEVGGILEHVVRLIAVAHTSLVVSFPVGVPQGAVTGVFEMAHAKVVVPRKVLLAALVEGGKEPG